MFRHCAVTYQVNPTSYSNVMVSNEGWINAKSGDKIYMRCQKHATF